MTSMWIVTLVVAAGIAALTIRAIQVTAQRDYWMGIAHRKTQECLQAWTSEEALAYEVYALQEENQYLQETIAYWVEDRMSDSKWDNAKCDAWENYDSPF